MTSRRETLILALAGLLPGLASAQAARKPLKIAWFSGGTIEDQKTYVDAFRKGMQDLGYLEGRDFKIQFFWRGETIKPYAWMARDVVGAQPDVIMATCEVTASAAKKVTQSIPIVLTASSDPVANGIVPSLARPGGNVTGISSTLIEASVKRIELVKEIIPSADRVAFLHWKYEHVSATEIGMLERTARSLGMAVQRFEAEDSADFERVFAEIRKARANAVVDLAGLALSFPFLDLLPELSARNRMPMVHFLRELVERGGLVSYGSSVSDGFRRSAHYVDRLAKGARAADLPIEQPTQMELWVNRKTARTLGVTVPDSVLLRADRVIG